MIGNLHIQSMIRDKVNRSFSFHRLMAVLDTMILDLANVNLVIMELIDLCSLEMPTEDTLNQGE